MENPLQFMWIFLTSIITVMGLNVLYNKSIVPEFCARVYNFGKTTKSLLHKKSFVSYFEIPKRWFAHFYIFASLYFFVLMVELLKRYFMLSSAHIIDVMLDVLASKNRSSSISPISALVLSVLITLHAIRRCYECFYVSIYSDSKMNLSHYLIAILFYTGVGLSLISEAPGFESKQKYPIQIKLSQLFSSIFIIPAIFLFIWASNMQHQINKRLAALRTDSEGKKIVTLTHVMPTGGWFELVSCPHFFAEILIYLSAGLIMEGKNYTWWLAVLFVITNQVLIGLSNHQWYQKIFKNYPTTRKAIIPFLL